MSAYSTILRKLTKQICAGQISVDDAQRVVHTLAKPTNPPTISRATYYRRRKAAAA